MHRISRVPHSLILLAFFGLAVLIGPVATRAIAQEKASVVQVPVNGTQILEMAKKQRIKDIENRDQNVARVEFLQGGDFRKVMIIGGGQAGLTRLTLIDNDGNKESFDVVVELNIEFLRKVLEKAAPTANIQIIQGTGGTLILTGTVALASDIDLIMRTATGAVGNPNLIVNGMKVGGVQLVQVDVVIARVARSEARSMGFSFLTKGTNGFLASTVGGGGSAAGSILDNPGAALAASPNIIFGIFNNNSAFLGFLEALRTENLVKLEALPKVTTLSGRPAFFNSGGEQAVPVIASGSAGGGAVSGVEFRPFGTTVKYLPLVLGGGKIYMEIEPEFSFPDPSNLFSAPIPGTNDRVFGRTTQKVQTSVTLEDGQTLAIGGMIFHQVNGSCTKVPVLGDLPFIGTAFSTINYTDSEEELLILITPHLIDAMTCKDFPKYWPGEETRKPDDFELFLERILEAPRGPREVWQCDKYVPAYKNGPVGAMFPCPTCNGPRGACDNGLSIYPGCGPDAGCLTGNCGKGVVVAPAFAPGIAPSVAPSAAPMPALPGGLVKPMAPAPQLPVGSGAEKPQRLPE
ncbi:MAG TPA: hypothetical protein VE988_01025, partial [Gemmataceae bacterium]|nr:hypothetical protein [Gemmataceae bacterium]